MEAATSASSAQAALTALREPWIRACITRDWDALLSMCTDDIVFMPHGMPSVEGGQVGPWLEEFPTIKEMSWDVGTVEEAGDIAFARGPVRQTLEMDGETVVMDGKYCDLLRRGADGTWRFAVIMWNQSTA